MTRKMSSPLSGPVVVLMQVFLVVLTVVYSINQFIEISALRKEVSVVKAALLPGESPESPRESSLDRGSRPKRHSIAKRNAGVGASDDADVPNESRNDESQESVVKRSLLSRRRNSDGTLTVATRIPRQRPTEPNVTSGPWRHRRRRPKQADKCTNSCMKDVEKAIKKIIRKKDAETKSVHFIAKIDEDRHARLPINDSGRVGTFKNGAFVPKGRILRIWEPSGWIDRKRFDYHQSTGSVHVKKHGIYMVYAQVVFYDAAARKSIGLYKNGHFVPILEAISFNVIHNEPAVQHGQTRQKRAVQLYSQCNFMGMVQLRKGDAVYIKSAEDDRGILLKDYLTYWGMTHVNA